MRSSISEKLGISEGVTGSLFAAVGPALPETQVLYGGLRVWHLCVNGALYAIYRAIALS